jgi:hypothetical protein
VNQAKKDINHIEDVIVKKIVNVIFALYAMIVNVERKGARAIPDLQVQLAEVAEPDQQVELAQLDQPDQLVELAQLAQLVQPDQLAKEEQPDQLVL